MQKSDTTNTRTLGKWIRRVSGIAKELDKSDNATQQQKLVTVVATVAERFENAAGQQPDTIVSQITPGSYAERKNILFEADKQLDDFQDPPAGYPEELETAITKDEASFGTVLKRLGQFDDAYMKDISELKLMPVERAHLSETDKTRPTNPQLRESPQVTSPRFNSETQERVYEQFEERLLLLGKGNHQASIMIVISDMESEYTGSIAQVIPLGHTFAALAETLTDFNSDAFLPDFWSKEIDPTQNCVTPSGVWWEWQDPSKKVIDAINKDGHLAIETVHKEVEYVVVLVKQGENESGTPIDIPRTCRQPAFLHLQERFPNYTVAQVRRMQVGDDASHVVFDGRFFRHHTNPLFVELKLGTVPQASTATLDTGAVLSNGKGKVASE